MRAARAAAHAPLVLVLALGLTLAAEGVARVLFDAPQSPYARHPLTGVEWRAGYRFERLSVDVPPVPFTHEVNALGFRGKAMRTPAKPDGAYRVFFLGASTTENAYLPEERTFPGRVQAALDGRLPGGPRIEVANAGVAGASTAGVFAMLVHRALPYSPDLAVVLVGHNHLGEALSTEWDPYGASEPERPPRLRDWLLGSSRLFAVLHRQRARWAENDKRAWYARQRRVRQAMAVTDAGAIDLARGIPHFRRWLGRFAAVCAEDGLALAFVTQPALYKPVMPPEESAMQGMTVFGDNNFDGPTLARALDLYNDATREVARERGATLVDAAVAVPKDLEHFSDDVHLTSKGNEAVAEAVVAAILRDGALPRTPLTKPAR